MDALLRRLSADWQSSAATRSGAGGEGWRAYLQQRPGHRVGGVQSGLLRGQHRRLLDPPRGCDVFHVHLLPHAPAGRGPPPPLLAVDQHGDLHVLGDLGLPRSRRSHRGAHRPRPPGGAEEGGYPGVVEVRAGLRMVHRVAGDDAAERVALRRHRHRGRGREGPGVGGRQVPGEVLGQALRACVRLRLRLGRQSTSAPFVGGLLGPEHRQRDAHRDHVVHLAATLGVLAERPGFEPFGDAVLGGGSRRAGKRRCGFLPLLAVGAGIGQHLVGPPDGRETLSAGDASGCVASARPLRKVYRGCLHVVAHERCVRRAFRVRGVLERPPRLGGLPAAGGSSIVSPVRSAVVVHLPDDSGNGLRVVLALLGQRGRAEASCASRSLCGRGVPRREDIRRADDVFRCFRLDHLSGHGPGLGDCGRDDRQVRKAVDWRDGHPHRLLLGALLRRRCRGHG
mmetsp:Transcript_17414/g.49741  ORF Transcript_17414/g.49741 Transcript_17414/m.49741 type:complete len:452 (+) Transcript_17414:514-1869(+)